MFREVVRHAGWRLGDRTYLPARVVRLDALDAPLDLANVVEILVEPPLVRGAQITLQARDLGS